MEDSQSIEQLSKQERRQLKKQRQNEERQRDGRRWVIGKTINVAVAIFAGGAGLFALSWYVMSRPNLPPTTIEGHIEESPTSHIVNQPIPLNIQKHMLEHADGKGMPGVIIQYNCEKYSCESDLISKLTDFVKQYPNNVYLAPNDYDGKIILTKMGSYKILDKFDEEMIKEFIQ